MSHRFFWLHQKNPIRFVDQKKTKGRPRGRNDCRWHVKLVLSSPVSPPNILLSQNIPLVCLQALACPPSARFGRLGFLDHFFCKHCILSDFFYLIFDRKKAKNALAGAFSAVTCSQNSLVLFERIFCVPLRPTTVFLSSFWFIFLLSFSKEGRKTNEEKLVWFLYNYPS